MIAALYASVVLATGVGGPIADGAAVGDGPVATYGSVAVVSRLAGGRYRLAEVGADGRLRDIDVPSRAVPFDVDIGPGPDGRVAAVYSRCRTEPRFGPGVSTFSYRTGSGCRI